MSIIMISFPCAILVGVMSDYFALPKWTDNFARVLFVLGLIAVPALFVNIAYEIWQGKNKKLAFQTIAFAIVMAIVALPLIVMLLKGLS